MDRSSAAMLVSALLIAPPAPAARIEGVEFAERVAAGESVLNLRGVALLRYRMLLKAYVAALYVADGVPTPRALEDVPRRLEIEYFWDIPSEGFARATLEGIARNVDASALEALRERIKRFSRLYRDIRAGDRYALTYIPDRGTELALNGEPLGSVEGADFATAMFSIWLGEAPLDASLKSALLGRG